jgi:hypothetical protein
VGVLLGALTITFWVVLPLSWARIASPSLYATFGLLLFVRALGEGPARVRETAG